MREYSEEDLAKLGKRPNRDWEPMLKNGLRPDDWEGSDEDEDDEEVIDINQLIQARKR